MEGGQNPFNTRCLRALKLELSPYRAENTTRLHDNDQLVKAVYENHRCLQWESYGTQKYTLQKTCNELLIVKWDGTYSYH
jgi:hypothetical protein